MIPIPTSTSLVGRLAGDPRLQESADGTVYVRVRVETFPPRRRLGDGSTVKADPVSVDLVGFEDVADVLHNRFRFGDWFIASGRLKPSKNGVESFIARRVGHDAVRADYTLRRTRKAPGRRRQASAPTEPTRAERLPIVAGRILPEPPTTRTA